MVGFYTIYRQCVRLHRPIPRYISCHKIADALSRTLYHRDEEIEKMHYDVLHLKTSIQLEQLGVGFRQKCQKCQINQKIRNSTIGKFFNFEKFCPNYSNLFMGHLYQFLFLIRYGSLTLLNIGYFKSGQHQKR